MDEKLLEILVCPLCKEGVEQEGDSLLCPKCNRLYPVCDGIPVMIVEDKDATLPGADPSLDEADRKGEIEPETEGSSSDGRSEESGAN